MKAKTIILFVIGAAFVIGIPSYEGVGATLVGVGLAALCFFFGWRSMKGAKKSKPSAPAVAQVPNDAPVKETSKDEPYEFLRIKLAGVTFKNGRKSRQSILRAIKFRDGEFADGVELELKPYEWEGQPAYGVYANGQQIGNVPADKVAYITENKDRMVDFSAIEVYGGGRDEEGQVKNFGCEVVLRLNK